jgi:hypothetical protein
MRKPPVDELVDRDQINASARELALFVPDGIHGTIDHRY